MIKNKTEHLGYTGTLISNWKLGFSQHFIIKDIFIWSKTGPCTMRPIMWHTTTATCICNMSKACYCCCCCCCMSHDWAHCWFHGWVAFYNVFYNYTEAQQGCYKFTYFVRCYEWLGEYLSLNNGYRALLCSKIGWDYNQVLL